VTTTRVISTQVTQAVGRLSVLTAATAFAVLLGALFAGFVSRELFGRGLIGADELARLSFVWCALFGASAAWRDNALHRIDLFTRNLHGFAARLTNAAAYALITGVLVYLVHYGWLMMQRALDQTTSTLQISGAWFYAPLPIAAGLMLVITIGRWLVTPDRTTPMTQMAQKSHSAETTQKAPEEAPTPQTLKGR
jgi:gluconokinase